jgi:hypothetical protein
MIMERATIQDWTRAAVPLKLNDKREVIYRVYREGARHFQEITDAAHRPIHTLELPDGMKLDQASYEVLLRYVLLDVAAA